MKPLTGQRNRPKRSECIRPFDLNRRSGLASLPGWCAALRAESTTVREHLWPSRQKRREERLWSEAVSRARGWSASRFESLERLKFHLLINLLLLYQWQLGKILLLPETFVAEQLLLFDAILWLRDARRNWLPSNFVATFVVIFNIPSDEQGTWLLGNWQPNFIHYQNNNKLTPTRSVHFECDYFGECSFQVTAHPIAVNLLLKLSILEIILR